MSVTDHARERAALRLGRALTDGEWRSVVLAIVDRQAVVVAESIRGRLVYAVPLGAVVLRVVWCPRAAMVLTVLPERERASGAGAEIRQSFAMPAHFRRGRRLRRRTEWA